MDKGCRPWRSWVLGWALSLGILLFPWQAPGAQDPAAGLEPAPPIYEPVVVKSIGESEHEEEGGFSSFTIYPHGWVHFSGRASCCGYVPAMKDGWYRVVDRQALQRALDAAVEFVTFRPDGDGRQEPARGGGVKEQTVELEDRSVYFNGRSLFGWVGLEGTSALLGKGPQPEEY